jgi:hypothetical protein
MSIIRKLTMLLGAMLLTLSLPIKAQSNPVNADRRCFVSQDQEDGYWTASRNVSVSGGLPIAGSEHHSWEPKASIEFGPVMTLKWIASYYRPRGTPAKSKVSEDDIMIDLFFTIKPQEGGQSTGKPQRSWLHFYRSTSLEKDLLFKAPSLSDIMFWTHWNSGEMSAKATFPLDDLLAFGAGFDALIWNIRSAPNEFGGTRILAKGMFPIATMKNQVPNLTKLSRLLDKKMTKFRQDCNPLAMAPVVPN